MTDDYTHPRSGRVYREGDPTHRFAQLVVGLVRQCESFLHYTDTDRDYLDLHSAWPGDSERIARAMAATLEAIDQASTDVVVDRDSYLYGLGERDEEWQRKYGNPTTEEPE